MIEAEKQALEIERKALVAQVGELSGKLAVVENKNNTNPPARKEPTEKETFLVEELHNRDAILATVSQELEISQNQVKDLESDGMTDEEIQKLAAEKAKLANQVLRLTTELGE
jgi:hypothetical protein